MPNILLGQLEQGKGLFRLLLTNVQLDSWAEDMPQVKGYDAEHLI